jgi:hypothetical protein
MRIGASFQGRRRYRSSVPQADRSTRVCHRVRAQREPAFCNASRGTPCRRARSPRSAKQWRLTTEPSLDGLSKTVEVRLRGKQESLRRVRRVREPKLTRLINLPHGLLHLGHALGAIRCEEKEVVGHVLVVPHFERTDVLRASSISKLTKVQSVEEPFARLRVRDSSRQTFL